MPLCVGRPAVFADQCANPSQELKRLADTGAVVRVAHGVSLLASAWRDLGGGPTGVGGHVVGDGDPR